MCNVHCTITKNARPLVNIISLDVWCIHNYINSIFGSSHLNANIASMSLLYSAYFFPNEAQFQDAMISRMKRCEKLRYLLE